MTNASLIETVSRFDRAGFELSVLCEGGTAVGILTRFPDHMPPVLPDLSAMSNDPKVRQALAKTLFEMGRIA